MNVSTNQESLAKAFGIVSRAVSSRLAMPVLGNILLDAKDNCLRLAATNREIGIQCWIDASVHDEGAITVPARLLTEFVNSLPPERIDMDLVVRTQTLGLKCGKFKANIKGIDAYEFPIIPTIAEDAQPFAIDVEELREMINRVTFAASDDVNRPTLTGVEVKLTGNQLTMAATDGYRLSVERHEYTVNGETLVVIPAKSLGVVAKIAENASGDAQIHITGKEALFAMTGDGDAKGSWQRCEVTTELIDARFPDYSATMPKTCETRVTVETAPLLKAVQVAKLFARDNANIVRLSATDGLLKLTATSPEMGDNVSELDATVDGPELEIAFNCMMLADALACMGRQTVLELTQPTRPGKLYTEGDDMSFVHVIMPMSLPR